MKTGTIGKYSWREDIVPTSGAKWVVVKYHNPETSQDEILVDGLVLKAQLTITNAIKAHIETLIAERYE